MFNKNRLFCAIVLCLVCPWEACSQELDTESIEALQRFAQEKVTQELGAIFRAKAELKIDDLERFEELKPGKLLKSKILAKKAVSEIQEHFSKQMASTVERNVARALGRMQNSTIEINGRRFTLEGEESPAPFLTVFLDVSRSRARWKFRRKGGSSSTTMGDDRLPFRIEAEPNWRKSIQVISDERLEKYEEFVEERGKKNVEAIVLSLLTTELNLSKTKRGQMEEFISGKLEYDSDLRLDENAKKSLGEEFFDEQPEFLSESQLRKWTILKYSIQLKRR